MSDKNQEGLKREIGVFGLSANIINSVIGAGIFVLPAIVAEKLGAASILAYLYCGVLIACVMLCFAEVGSKITQSGGAYSYIEAAFGKYAGFLATNLFVLGVTVLASAAIANALADTLSFLIPTFKGPVFRFVFHLTVFSGLAILNIHGVKQGIALVKITTIAKLTPLVLLIFVGATNVSQNNLSWDVIPSLSAVGEMSLVLFFAFQGAENGLTVGGEIKHPSRTIPKGIFFAFIVILGVYTSLQLISQGVLGADLPTFKSAPLAEVANRIVGLQGTTIMIAGACISMFGYLSGDILNIPRVLFAASRDEVIPVKLLSRVHPIYATPYISIILFTSFAFMFAVVGEFKQLAILSSSSILLIYLGVASAVIKLRWKGGSKGESFKIPGGYFVPCITIATILWLLSNLPSNEKFGMMMFVLLLSAIYWAIHFKQRHSPGRGNVGND